VFTDSHCHLDFPGLVEQLPDILSRMQAAQVSRALCISVQLEDFPNVLALAENHEQLWATEITLDPAGNEAGRQKFEIPLSPKL